MFAFKEKRKVKKRAGATYMGQLFGRSNNI